MNMNYYCFFPVRDGQESIDQVMNSLVNQTYQPKAVIVVDDGSTDNTAEILAKYEIEFRDFVRVIHTDSKTRDYRRIPKLWNMCLRKEYDYHMIGAGDCIFERGYAEKLISKLEENPNLVLCSGDFGTRKSLSPHGAGRFVKQSFFFRHYTKYPEIIGYESEIIFRAIIQKYDVKIFNDIKFEHVDKLGHIHNFDEFGQGMKAMGYHPLYVLGRCWLEFIRNGEIGKRGALNMLWKYITFRPQKDGYYSFFSEETRKEIRSLQAQRMKKFIANPRKIRELLS